MNFIRVIKASKTIDINEVFDMHGFDDIGDYFVDPTNDDLEVITYDNGKEVKNTITKEEIKKDFDIQDFEWNFDNNEEVVSLTPIGIPAVEYRSTYDAIHHLALFNNRQDALYCFNKMVELEDLNIEDQEEYDSYIEDAFKKSYNDIEVNHTTIHNDSNYDIVNKDYLLDF